VKARSSPHPDVLKITLFPLGGFLLVANRRGQISHQRNFERTAIVVLGYLRRQKEKGSRAQAVALVGFGHITL